MAFDLDEEELRATRKMNKADRDEIEVNEYVRTKNGVIDKVDTLYGMIENTVHLENQKWFDTKNIVKHSKQLIDLIEVGDIVEIRTGLYSSFKYFVENEDNLLLLEEQIKQFWNIKIILTKEQFDVNCYKVGGEDE